MLKDGYQFFSDEDFILNRVYLFSVDEVSNRFLIS